MTAPVELPNWDLAKRDTTKEAANPLPLPDLCAIPSDGTWSVECWKKLDAHDLVSEANYSIAQDNANASKKSDGAYDELLGAAKVQQELSQIRQDLLEQERRAHTMDNWFYRVIIALGLIGAAL